MSGSKRCKVIVIKYMILKTNLFEVENESDDLRRYRKNEENYLFPVIHNKATFSSLVFPEIAKN